MAVKTLPSLIFLIMALVRFCEIKPIGFQRTTVYSQLFLWKVRFSYFLAAYNVVLIVLAVSLPSSWGHAPLISRSDKKALSIIYFFNVGAWIVSAKLMAYEYKKRLSEAFYSHQLFWILNVVTEVATFFVNFSIIVSTFFLRVTPCPRDGSWKPLTFCRLFSTLPCVDSLLWLGNELWSTLDLISKIHILILTKD